MRRRTRLMCHCEEQSDVAISGRHLRLVQAIADRTHLVGGGVLDAPPRNGTIFAGGFPVVRPGTARLPRRFAPRNDTSGEREVHQCPPAV